MLWDGVQNLVEKFPDTALSFQMFIESVHQTKLSSCGPSVCEFFPEGKMRHDVDRRMGTASSLIRPLDQTVALKARLWIYQSTLVPPLSYSRGLNSAVTRSWLFP